MTSRTPLAEAAWTGPSETEVLDSIAARLPILVRWDSITLDSSDSPLSLGVQPTEEPEIIERDCPDAPLFLRVPVTLSLDVGSGGVRGDLQGELRAEPDGRLTVRAQGELEPAEPWVSLGEAHVEEKYGEGSLEEWYATLLDSWDEAELGIDAVGHNADGGGSFVSALWRGHWVLAE